jgi:hypothetical protein
LNHSSGGRAKRTLDCEWQACRRGFTDRGTILSAVAS